MDCCVVDKRSALTHLMANLPGRACTVKENLPASVWDFYTRLDGIKDIRIDMSIEWCFGVAMLRRDRNIG